METSEKINKTQTLHFLSPTLRTLETTKETAQTCDGRCFAERRVHCRELRWGKPMLMTIVGLENVFQRALGPLQWRKYCKAVKASIANPRDFCFIEESLCDWCLNPRMAATGYDSCPTMNEELLGGDSVSCSTLAASSSSSATNASPTSTISTSRNLDKCSAMLSQSTSILNGESTDRSSLSAASLLMESAAATAANCNNSGTTMSQQHLLGIQSSMAFLASLFNQGATNYPQASYLPTMPSTFSSPLQKTSSTAALQSPSIMGAAFPQTITFPLSLPPQFNTQSSLDVQQQLVMNWHSQLLALGFLNSMQQHQQNGFIFPPPLPLASVIHPTSFDQQQLLSSASSDEEAFSLFLGQYQQRKYSPPTSHHIFSPIESRNKGDIPSQRIGDEQPLDLSAKTNALKTTIGKNCPPRLEIGIPVDGCSPHLMKGILSQQIRSDSRDVDEEIDLNESRNTNNSCVDNSLIGAVISNSNLLEDGSEAETPKLLGVKKYSQTDLDAAVLDIRLGRLGTRRASVVYGIPRSTLRNKIYKLEAADELLTNGLDCSTNTSRHRRLAAFALNKRKRIASTPISSSAKLKKEIHHEATEDLDNKPNCKFSAEKNCAMIPKGVIKQQQQLDVLVPNASTSLPIANSSSLPAITAETFLKEITSIVGQAKNIDSELANSISTESHCDFDLEKYQDQDHFDPKCKGKRQKRGQYRKYNKEALDKAVTAVRNGEMSVHRAGSHFGVPHSTLEYKVKERNLMRIKSKKQHGVLRQQPILTVSSDASGLQQQHSQYLQNNIPNKGNNEEYKNEEEEEESCSPITGEVQNLLGTMLKSLISTAAANRGNNDLC